MTREHVHFIGIGGAGMSGIAQIMAEMGHQVSGSDLSESARTRRLQRLGVTVHVGHSRANLGEPDLVVTSSAVPADNVELAAARERAIPVLSRAEMLGRLMADKVGIAVSGTHGKTTTTSMIHLMLQACGQDPSCVIGGELNDIGSNARLGQGAYFVAEADESDASFLKLRPRMAVVTNIEADHLDHYGSLEAIVEAFRRFLGQLPPDGLAVLCADDATVMGLLPLHCPHLSYGLDPAADCRVEDVQLLPLGSTGTVIYRGRRLGALSPNVPGLHNMVNALAAVGVGLHLGLPFANIARAVNGFRGAERRFEVLGSAHDVLVVDDYGHHPTEIRATLQAAKNLDRRVVAVFQPHRYSRTRFLKHEFARSFSLADVVILTDIYAALEAPMPEVRIEDLARAISEYEEREVALVKDKGRIPDFLLETVRPGDLVLTLGAGDIRAAGEAFLQRWAALPGLGAVKRQLQVGR